MVDCCKPPYTPASLRHSIELQELTLTPNDTGGQAEAWATYATVWAAITPKLKSEVVFGQKLESRVEHEIVCRYLDGVTTDDRILFDGRIFQIKAVIIVNEIKEWLKIQTMEFTGT